MNTMNIQSIAYFAILQNEKYLKICWARHIDFTFVRGM